MKIFPLAARGAPLIQYVKLRSTMVSTRQTSSPVPASTATRYPPHVAM